MCISEVLERSAGNDRCQVLPSAELWLARAAVFSSSQRLKAAVPELKVYDLVSISPTDVLVTEGLCRQPPNTMHCLQLMPAGIKQLLLLLEALLVGDSGKYESLYLGAKGMRRLMCLLSLAADWYLWVVFIYQHRFHPLSIVASIAC